MATRFCSSREQRPLKNSQTIVNLFSHASHEDSVYRPSVYYTQTTHTGIFCKVLVDPQDCALGVGIVKAMET